MVGRVRVAHDGDDDGDTLCDVRVVHVADAVGAVDEHAGEGFGSSHLAHWMGGSNYVAVGVVLVPVRVVDVAEGGLDHPAYAEMTTWAA